MPRLSFDDRELATAFRYSGCPAVEIRDVADDGNNHAPQEDP